MKISGKIWAVCMLLACGCLWSAGNVSAKVCFVGDPDCGSGGEFGSYIDPDADGSVCIKEGYTVLATACKDNPHKQISAYCPYNSNYVICCGKEYSYDACVYPLVNKGRCGSKYKCECDSSQYKYTDRECKTVKGHAGEGYENSYASGASCMQTGYDSKSGKITTEIKYSSCQCDRGIYPKDPKDCDNNAEKNGPCSTKYSGSAATELYYKFCRCNTNNFPKTDAGCYPLTGDASRETCFDTIMHYESCASCDRYKAKNLDHVAYNSYTKPRLCEYDQKGNLKNSDCDYEVCPYDQTANTFFRIKKCNEPGYKAKADGSGCEPIPCKDAVNMYVKEYSSAYGIFDGTNFLDANGSQSKASQAIVYGNITVSGSSVISSTPVYKRVCTYMSCASMTEVCQYYETSDYPAPRCTYPYKACCRSAYNKNVSTTTVKGELGKSTALTYYSPAQLSSGSSDGAKAMKVACTVTPTITISASTFPEASKKAVKFYGLNVKMSANSTKLTRPLTIVNGTLTVNTLNVYSALNTEKSEYSSNSAAAKVKGGNLNFYSGSSLFSHKVDYEIGEIFFNNGGSNTDPLNKIQYPASFVANKLYTRGSGTNVMLCGGKYYIVRSVAGWPKEKDGNNIWLMCNATYYMYSSRSNDHAIESNACAGFRVKTGSVVQAQTWNKTNGSWKSCRYKSDQGRAISNGNPKFDQDGTAWCGYQNSKCGKNKDCC